VILAGDIGGTHTRLALFEGGQKGVERKFLSQNYSGLEQIVREFLVLEKKQVSKASFGIAGLVEKGKCKATNLPWIVDAHLLSQNLNIPSVVLLNDLEANAYGISALKKDQLVLIQKGDLNRQGNQALIAAGTGLGEAALFWNGHSHHPFGCEGGHVDFSPRNELEIELFLYLKKQFEHVSYERVLSGPGLLSLYRFLTETGKEKALPIVQEEMKKKNPSFVISEWGLTDKDRACARALDWFISLYGAEAGNLALKFLALGGVYIGGGIAPHLQEKFKTTTFLSSFADKGRFKDLLQTIPIWLILNDDTALLGAAIYGDQFESRTR
jgi:glucokinase